MDILEATSPCQKRERGTRRRLHFLFSRFFGKGDRICAVHCRPKTFPIQLIAMLHVGYPHLGRCRDVGGALTSTSFFFNIIRLLKSSGLTLSPKATSITELDQKTWYCLSLAHRDSGRFCRSLTGTAFPDESLCDGVFVHMASGSGGFLAEELC